jgi:hypothetical protein
MQHRMRHYLDCLVRNTLWSDQCKLITVIRTRVSPRSRGPFFRPLAFISAEGRRCSLARASWSRGASEKVSQNFGLIFPKVRAEKAFIAGKAPKYVLFRAYLDKAGGKPFVAYFVALIRSALHLENRKWEWLSLETFEKALICSVLYVEHRKRE